MPSYRTVTGENAAIELYCKQLDDVVNTRRPDPPEAIIERKNGVFEWIEVTTVWKGEHKKDHKSFAKALNDSNSNGEIFHHDYRDGYWKTLEVDLIYSIKKKDNISTYQPFLEKYGKGVLILNLEDPYYGPDEVKHICLEMADNLTHFGIIFIHLSEVHEMRGGQLYSSPSRLIPVIFKEKWLFRM